ncbi:hypothetical protein [Litoribacillus peritrichatus]|uniref:Transposase n=1 Tax=Litoribacillus peritrichatus TaxID=718191 RepID=A0ABP7MJZ8_9GAMM
MSGSTKTPATLRGPISLYHGSENSDKLNEWQLHELEVLKKELDQQRKTQKTRTPEGD